MKTIGIDVLKTRYPQPRACTYPKREGYSVDGALGLYLARGGETQFPFPDLNIVSTNLMFANPELDRSVAESFAEEIIVLNDAGCFDCAWAILAQALVYPK